MENKLPVITYLVFDKKSGAIVLSHQSFDAEKEEYCECSIEQVKTLVADDDIAMSKVTDGDPRNLEVFMTDIFSEHSSPGMSGFLVDVKTKKLVKKPKIELSSERKQLEGDGKDKSSVNIKIVDEKGEVVKGYNGKINVTTSRGKLSAKGGVVELKKGVGKITITSVNETVSQVKMFASSTDSRTIVGSIDFEFI